MNNNLTEFIIKHQDFYNCLSKENKHRLRIITEFGDLELFDIRALSDRNKKDFPKANTRYLYIGKNEYYMYYYECEKSGISTKIKSVYYYNKYDISNGRIIAIRKLEEKYKENMEFI